MPSPSRNAVGDALEALGAGLTWGSPPQSIVYTSRKPQLPDELEGQMPALCQAEYLNDTTQITRMPQRRIWEYAWMIYHFSGNSDAVPARTTADILDAVDALFPPEGTRTGMQRLGGLVHKVWIEGKTEVYGGNVTEQVLIVVPLRVLVP